MRTSGILMHLSSLPNQYGIGKMGNEARNFINYLAQAGQKKWQMLPLSPTSFGDSPYQSFSIYAGNPYFIDFEQLEVSGYLKAEEYKNIRFAESKDTVNYNLQYIQVYKVLKKAFNRFKESTDKDYENFKEENSYWLNEYALFMALKEKHGGKAWCEWEDKYKFRNKEALSEFSEENSEIIEFQKFMQYEFFKQWYSLKSYANEKQIEIIGDIPIYTAYDSIDVWSNPKEFQLDENRIPKFVAGFPPDDFSEKGQLWGNPLYDWNEMKKNGYNWWVNRVKAAKQMYDIVRIDHFIGFDRYYSIPYGNKDAKNGEWRDGPQKDLFKKIKESTGNDGIVAENLGIVTDRVKELLKFCGYPGMKILQFGFSPDAKSEYLPQNYSTSNCVVYTGTHDNSTMLGWIEGTNENERNFCKKYLNVKENKEAVKASIRLAYESIADTVIIPMQDILMLDDKARMNIPSTLGSNWKWRATSEQFTEKDALWLKELVEITGR